MSPHLMTGASEGGFTTTLLGRKSTHSATPWRSVIMSLHQVSQMELYDIRWRSPQPEGELEPASLHPNKYSLGNSLDSYP